jgi:hypothetical protein
LIYLLNLNDNLVVAIHALFFLFCSFVTASGQNDWYLYISRIYAWQVFCWFILRSIRCHWILLLYQHCGVHFVDGARNLFVLNFRVCFRWILQFWGLFNLSSKAIYFLQILFWLITYNFNNYLICVINDKMWHYLLITCLIHIHDTRNIYEYIYIYIDELAPCNPNIIKETNYDMRYH